MRSRLLLSAAALALLPASTAHAGVLTGTSGWAWGNPLPQGNKLDAMAFSGLTGYAAGAFGTLLKTEDGGATWTGLRTGTAQELTQVQIVDPTTIVAGAGCVARESRDGGQSFSRIAFTPVESSCDQPLVSLSFASPDAGYLLLADGSVLQTNDGGKTFTPRTAVPGTKAAGGGSSGGAISFRSATGGYAATSSGDIYTTADQGQSWTQVADTGVGIDRITFVSAMRAYATGGGGGLVRSVDGGATWKPEPSGAEHLTGIACSSEDTCLLATGTPTLLRTTDGAKTPPTPVVAGNDPFNAVAFASETRAVAGGQRGSTVVSDDAGLTFAPIGGRLDGSFTSVVAGAAAKTAYAPGPRGTLGRTADGGQTWQRGNIPSTSDVVTVSFPSALQGYALDARSGLFRTQNAAASWAPLDVGSTAQVTDVVAPSAGTVVVATRGGLRRSTDDGDEFQPVTGDALKKVTFAGVDVAGAGKVVAFGPKALVASADGGKTFETVLKPGPYVKGKDGKLHNDTVLRDADFVSPTSGWVITSSGKLFHTTTSGRKWAEQPGAGVGLAGETLAMSSERAGFMTLRSFGDLGEAGFVLRTNDGGTTWHPQLVAEQSIQGGGVAVGGSTAYALAGDGLLATDTGGDAGKPSTLTLNKVATVVKKAGAITITGKLAPAQGGERVTVAVRDAKTGRWTPQTVRTGATGSFTASVKVSVGENPVVAQWSGDFRSAGDGSDPLIVKVARPKA